MIKSKLLFFIVIIFPFISGFTTIAHRGDNENGRYAEHSWTAYDRALCEHCDYLELDLQESSDGVIVVSHDDNLSRVFGVDKEISQNLYHELTKYRNYSNEALLTLEQVFRRYQGNQQVKFMVEPKDKNMEPILYAMIKKYNLEKRVFFESFNLASLKRLHRLDPFAPEIQLSGNYHQAAAFSGYASSFYSKDAASFLNKQNKDYIIWGVNSPAQIKRFYRPQMKVTGIMTDFPNRLLKPVSYRLHNIAASAYITAAYCCPVYGLKGMQVKVTAVKMVNNQLYYQIDNVFWLNAAALSFAPKPKANNPQPITKAGTINLKHASPVYTDISLTKSAKKILHPGIWHYFAVYNYLGHKYYNLGGAQWIKVK